MTTAEIEAFLAICEYKNISKAADKLFISQPSLSTKVKTLENEIGCVLFKRGQGNRALSLTEKGIEFYKLAIEYSGIIQRMKLIGSSPLKPKLRVSSLSSMGTYLFAPVYERFINARPDANLEIQDMATSLAYTYLINGLTDLAFTASLRQSGKVTSKKLFSEPMVFVCAEESDYPDVIDMTKLDIKHEIYIEWCDDFKKWHESQFDITVEPQIRLELMSQLEFFVAKAKNWSIVPISVADGLTRNNKIKKCKLTMEIPKRITMCLYVTGQAKNELMDCFLQCLKSELIELEEPEIEIYI